MAQATASRTDIRTYRNLTLAATVTYGVYAINVFAGPTRLPELAYATRDRASYRARYRLLAEAAIAGQRPDRIAEAIHGAARAALEAAAEVLNLAVAQ